MSEYIEFGDFIATDFEAFLIREWSLHLMNIFFPHFSKRKLFFQKLATLPINFELLVKALKMTFFVILTQSVFNYKIKNTPLHFYLNSVHKYLQPCSRNQIE